MLRRMRRMVDAVLARTRFERDLRDELRIHVEHRTQDLIAAGLSPADAARQARIEFGAAETYKEQCRDARGFAAFRPFHGLEGDLRLATRRLLATPQFLIFAVLSLAIGIGVTTSVYSILYSLIWKPLGLSDPDRVVLVATRDAGLSGRMYLSYPDFQDLRASTRTLSVIAASSHFYQTLVTPEASDALEGEAVTGEYFRTTGVGAIIGRTIQPSDDDSGARVLVLNHRIWRGRFAADSGIVGRVVRLGGEPFEVIGVAPRSFDGIERQPFRAGGWIPLRAMTAFRGNPATFASRDRRQLTVFGRLTSAGTPATAAAELGAIAARLDLDFPYRTTRFGQESPSPLPRGWSARGIGQLRDSDTRMASLIIALVALVLVVACTNLANLMLARGAARQREIAVRRALGAGRWRLVRELVVESTIVAIIGGARDWRSSASCCSWRRPTCRSSADRSRSNPR